MVTFKNNKGQAIGITVPLVLSFVIAALVISVTGYILQDYKGHLETGRIGNVSNTVTATNASFVRLTGVNSPDAIVVGSVLVFNTSGTSILNNVAGGNFTINYARMSIYPQVSTKGSFGYTSGDSWVVEYAVDTASSSANITDQGLNATGTLADWLDVIALILVAGALIFIISTSLQKQSM